MRGLKGNALDESFQRHHKLPPSSFCRSYAEKCAPVQLSGAPEDRVHKTRRASFL
jgi:hypothetical protein